MESVVIIAPSDCTLDQLRNSIPAKYAVTDASDGRIVVRSAGSRAYLGVDSKVIDDLEPDEVARIREFVAEPTFIVLEYADIALCKDLLANMVDRPDVLVYNDHGVVVPGSEFMQAVRREPRWDWRRD